MLPRKNRLTQEVDFQAVLKSGKTVHGRYYAFLYVKTEAVQKKIGTIVPNKISKKAVVRNKIKRAARTATSRMLKELSGGILGVFLAKKQAETQEFTVLTEDALEVLTKVVSA